MLYNAKSALTTASIKIFVFPKTLCMKKCIRRYIYIFPDIITLYLTLFTHNIEHIKDTYMNIYFYIRTNSWYLRTFIGRYDQNCVTRDARQLSNACTLSASFARLRPIFAWRGRKWQLAWISYKRRIVATKKQSLSFSLSTFLTRL